MTSAGNTGEYRLQKKFHGAVQVPNVQVLYFIKFPGHRLLLNLACADLSIWRANVGLPQLQRLQKANMFKYVIDGNL